MIDAEPPSSIAAGAGFGLAVSVEDAFGNAEPDYSGNVTLALTGGSGLNGTLSVPASGGVASFSGLSLDQVGTSYAIQAGAPGLSGATTSVFAITPATPSQLLITTEPSSSITAGSGFGVTVAVEDPYGNAEPGYSGDVSLALAGGAGLGGTLTISADDGVASFSGLTIDRAGSGYTLQASGAGLTGASSTAFLVTPATASQLVTISQPPTNLTAGQAFGFTVAAEDPYGNVVTGFDGTVTASMASDPGSAPLLGSLTVTASQGLANFSGLTIDRAGAGYTLGAAAGNLSSAVTGALSVSPAAASQLVVTAQPPSIVTAGSGFGVSVAAEDAYGNVATSFQGSVTAALTGGANPGVLGGNNTATAVNGVAMFSGLVLTEATYGDRLQLNSGGLSSTTTNTITVNAGEPARWVFISEPPATVAPRQTIRIVAAIEDAYGNVVLSESGTASLSLLGGPRDARLHGSPTEPVYAGVAVFADSISDTPGVYSLSLSGDGLPSVTSNSFKVIAIDPAASVFSSVFRPGRGQGPGSQRHPHRGR